MLGLYQQIKVTHLQLSGESVNELNERFCLIYTGQKRLARKLLKDVVGSYIGNEPDALYALNEIQRMAALMRFELERGNVNAFATLLGEHCELSKKLDSGRTNNLIDQIFSIVEEYVDGKMICGAGGGKGVKKEQVEEKLKSVF